MRTNSYREPSQVEVLFAQDAPTKPDKAQVLWTRHGAHLKQDAGAAPTDHAICIAAGDIELNPLAQSKHGSHAPQNSQMVASDSMENASNHELRVRVAPSKTSDQACVVSI